MENTMTKVEALAELQSKFVKIAKYGSEEQDAEIKAIVDAIPPTIRGEYSEIPEVAALQYWDTFYGKSNGGVPGNRDVQTPADNKIKTKTTERKSYTAPTSLSQTANSMIDDIMSPQNEAKKYQLANATTILQYIFRKENATELGKNMPDKAIPKYEDSKIQEWEGKLVQTEVNLKAFADFKAANNKTGLKVRITNPQSAPIGVVVSTPADEEGKAAPTTMTKTVDQLKGFLAYKLPCFIPTGENELGAELKAYKTVTKKSDTTAMVEEDATPVLRVNFTGRKQARENKSLHDFACELLKEGGKVVTETGKVSLDITFEIEEDDTTGTTADKIKKTIRPRGEAQLPVLVLKKDYASIFPQEKKAGKITAPTTEEEKRAKRIEQTNILKGICAEDFGVVSDFGAEFKELNKAINEKSASAAVDQMKEINV